MSPPDRTRSRSPPRKSKGSSGLRWKEKPRKQETQDGSRSDDRRRDYRDRSPRQEKGRDRPEQHRSGDSSRHDTNSEQGQEKRKTNKVTENRALESDAQDKSTTGETATTAPIDKTSTAAKFGTSYKPRPQANDTTTTPSTTTISSQPIEKKSSSKPPKRPSAPPVSNEQMIIVNINDRLGTKAAIPCLASDPVKAFKAMVAARIGRQPHEIMIKRQGERPFKDQLTLEDYGVSNGVQLDLELDTGD